MPWIEHHNAQQPLQWMVLVAVFFLSQSALAFEVLLTRIFSISQWHHLSFMVLSIALFGFAASGTFLSILGAYQLNISFINATPRAILVHSALFALSVIIAYTGLTRLPLDYFKIPVQPIQMLYLLLIYLLLTGPFFLTGVVISISFSRFGSHAGHIYFASMAGSACGALIPTVGLSYLGIGPLISGIALAPIIILIGCQLPPPGRLLLSHSEVSRNRPVGLMVFLGIAAAAIIFLSFKYPMWFDVTPSDYKALSQILKFPDTHISRTVHGIRGRLDVVDSQYVRSAPGLSLAFNQPLPRQTAVFTDGDRPFYLFHISSPLDLEFAKYTTAYSGYYLREQPERVLVIESGGGLGVACAFAAQPAHLDILVPNPNLAAVMKDHYRQTIINQPVRSYLQQTKTLYDVIQIDDWGTSVPGTAALSQSHMFTIEALNAYLGHLAEGGILIFTRKLLLPPADSLRMWASAYTCLQTLNIDLAPNCIAMLRNWDTYTLLISNRPIEYGDRIRSFVQNRNFDIVYLQATPTAIENRFAIFDRPYHFIQIRELARAYQSNREHVYFDAYVLDVAPQSDNRPFPSRFLKWSRIRELYQTSGSRLYSLMMSGEIVVMVVFAEALAIALILLIIPSIVLHKSPRRLDGYPLLFFLSVGAGFMFVEVFFIKKLMLLFGDPVVSFTVTLTAILVFSAIGGYWSQHLTRKRLSKVLLLLIAVLIVHLTTIDTILPPVFRLPIGYQYLIAAILMAPTGILMGVPFPLAMRAVSSNAVQRSHAWAANGVTSVLASIVAMQLALSLGIHWILLSAISAYLMALLGSVGTHKGRG